MVTAQCVCVETLFSSAFFCSFLSFKSSSFLRRCTQVKFFTLVFFLPLFLCAAATHKLEERETSRNTFVTFQTHTNTVIIASLLLIVFLLLLLLLLLLFLLFSFCSKSVHARRRTEGKKSSDLIRGEAKMMPRQQKKPMKIAVALFLVRSRLSRRHRRRHHHQHHRHHLRRSRRES